MEYILLYVEANTTFQLNKSLTNIHLFLFVKAFITFYLRDTFIEKIAIVLKKFK